VTRVEALLRKELLELRAHPGIFVPAVLTGALALALPFIVAIGIPVMTGDPLASSPDDDMVSDIWSQEPSWTTLSPEGTVQAWLFRQFLLLLTLSPVAAAMSVAAWSIVGEKQGRTLEPLLASPLTTFELLTAKTLSALLPAMTLQLLMSVLYVVGTAVAAAPGVAATLLTPEPLIVMLVISPLAALAALQLAVCMSSRANDPRSAQQMGALVILPLAAAMVLQLMGAVDLGAREFLIMTTLLAGANVVLARVSVALFDRESILTRWR
jgi:ABC-2 type transport system permease protein